MDDDTKKRYMGMCNFLLLFTFSTAAFICTITSTGYCAFVSRNIVLSEPASTVCEGYEGETMQCETFLQNHGVGFWGWQSTVSTGARKVMSISARTTPSWKSCT